MGRGVSVRRLSVALAVVVLAATQAAAAPHAFVQELTFEGVQFSLRGTGELKAKALFTTVTLCEFAKYEAHDDAQQVRPKLLVLHFARKLSADQLRQVLRGVVEGHTGYSETELAAFLAFLQPVATDAVLQFRADSAGELAVFAAGRQLGSVVAPQLAAALWAGLGTEDTEPAP